MVWRIWSLGDIESAIIVMRQGLLARVPDRYQTAFLCALVVLCPYAHPVLAVTNSLTITEKAGKTTANYPIQIGRPFVQGEIANFPQAVVGGTPVLTQADIKQRWPDGSVRHAILTFLLPTLAANGTVAVTFQNQPSGNNTGYLAQQDMLGAGYDFDAGMQLTNGSSVSASARTMLQAGAFTYWLQGQVATSIILADHSATRAYDIGFDSNRSFRPIFHATFWPAIKKVRVRFIGEIANTEALQDQVYALALTTGSASPATVFTKTRFTHTANSRWTKEFWIGGVPSAIAIDHNLAYLAATTLIPNYDTSKHPSESVLASEYVTWTGASTDLYGAGNWTMAMGTTGGRREIGPYPAWTVRWLYTGDSRMHDQAFGNADLAAAWPLHYREGKTGKYLDRTRAVPGLGRVMSISTRPTLCLSCPGGGNYQYTVDADKVVPVGSVTNGGWTPDAAHFPDPFSPEYMLTGEFWYLEEMYFWSGWVSATSNGAAYNYSYGRGPTGAEGGIPGQVRGQAWTFRSRLHTTSLAPDGAPEQQYFRTLIDDAIAVWEGWHNITGTSFQSTTNWKWGNTTGMGVWTGNTGIPTLRFWWNGDASFVQSPIESATTKYACSPWEQNFLLWSLGRAAELGYPATALKSWLATNIIGQLTDPSYSPYLIASYRLPTVRLSDSQCFSTWAGVKTGYLSSFDPVASFNNYLTDAEHGYSVIAIAATSQVANEPGGGAAWSWIAQNALTASVLNDNPKWAIVPRSVPTSGRPAPPQFL